MTNPDGRVAAIEEDTAGTVDAREVTIPRRAEAPAEERRAAEKPQATDEIVIEEISIDGMCGVY
jgi:mycofactocin precursor